MANGELKMENEAQQRLAEFKAKVFDDKPLEPDEAEVLIAEVERLHAELAPQKNLRRHWLTELFQNPGTSLEDLKKAGFVTAFSSSGSWWFERRDPESREVLERVYPPHWVHQLEGQAERRGRNHVAGAICHALGVKPKTDALKGV